MKPTLIEVMLGRIRMKVPVIVDEATTLRAVDAVNARLDEIEKQSQRVDTFEFALLASLSFAGELEQTKHSVAAEREQLAESSSEDTKSFFKELDKIAEALDPTPKKQGPRLLK
jgi:cell division protein ZapA (FtsZ GTPase activity inhibitor)